jgi:hypothetical protein
MTATEDSTKKRKKRKPTKAEIKMKLVDSIPIKDRWWSVWGYEPSHTVASIVSQQPQFGGDTEVIWNQKNFENNFLHWIEHNKDKKFLNYSLFTGVR